MKLHFNHAKNFEEAKALWETRKERINWDHLFIQMYTVDRDAAERFDSLPFENKAVIVPFESELESAISLAMFHDRLEGEINAFFWKNVIAMGKNQLSGFNLIKLINGKKDFWRGRDKRD